MTPPDDTAKGSGASGSALCQQLAESVLDDYNSRLLEMLENSTHGLSVDDIRAFAKAYKEETLRLERSRFKAHFQRCLSRREQEVFDPNRREPFKRVITMRFVDMFPPEGKLDSEGGYLSRRMLPGFFLALEKMVGADPFLKGHETCTKIMESVRNEDGIVIWEDLYNSDAALEAMDDLLMHLVIHFEDPMKRIAWMLNIINNDLADPLEYDFEGDVNRNWELDERGLVNTLRHLFRHLRVRVKDKAHAHALAEKYGQHAAHQLVALITALDQAEV